MKKKATAHEITHAAVIADFNNNLVVPYRGHIFKAEMICLLACDAGFPQDMRGLPVELTDQQREELSGILFETLKESRSLYFERIAQANKNAVNLIKDSVAELTKQDEHVE